MRAGISDSYRSRWGEVGSASWRQFLVGCEPIADLARVRHNLVVPTPVLRALMESGKTWDDPSEDLIFELLADVDRGEEQFIVLERTSDPSGQTYAQSIRDEDGSYLVERRDGGPEAHFRLTSLTMREAHAVLSAWAFEMPGWASNCDWRPVQV